MKYGEVAQLVRAKENLLVCVQGVCRLSDRKQ